jgi:hypothetical protein
MRMSVSMRLVGAQRAFFDRHLKTHDQMSTMKYLGMELLFEQCNKIKRKVHQVFFF